VKRQGVSIVNIHEHKQELKILANQLAQEAAQAIEGGAYMTMVRTPGAHRAELPAWAVFEDWLGSGDANVKALFDLVSNACRAGDLAIRYEAQALVARIATAHGAYHCGDALAEQEARAEEEEAARRDDCDIPGPSAWVHIPVLPSSYMDLADLRAA
jgi:hypothetical protein